MKRSAKITLVLISSISLLATGCSSQQATKREMYQNLEDCVSDWGSPQNCQPTNPSNSFSYYMGPDYYYSKGGIYYFPPWTDRAQVLNPNTNFAMAHKQDAANTATSTGGGSGSGNWNYSSGNDKEVKSKSIGQVSSVKTIARGGFGKSGSIFGRGS